MIFLDFDGVLVPFSRRDKKQRPAVACEAAVDHLNKLCLDTGAVVAVVSDWTATSSFTKIEECLRCWGFEGRLVGMVVPGPNKSKLQRILGFMQMFEDPTDSFVILDDSAEGLENFTGNLVQPNPLVGLTLEDAELAARILKK